SRELHGVCHGFFAVIESVANALLNIGRYLAHQSRAEIPADDVSAKRKRQAGPLDPPFAEIDNLVETELAISQLPFMNQQTRFALSALYVFQNAIERRHFVFHCRLEK